MISLILNSQDIIAIDKFYLSKNNNKTIMTVFLPQTITKEEDLPNSLSSFSSLAIKFNNIIILNLSWSNENCSAELINFGTDDIKSISFIKGE